MVHSGLPPKFWQKGLVQSKIDPCLYMLRKDGLELRGVVGGHVGQDLVTQDPVQPLLALHAQERHAAKELARVVRRQRARRPQELLLVPLHQYGSSVARVPGKGNSPQQGNNPAAAPPPVQALLPPLQKAGEDLFPDDALGLLREPEGKKANEEKTKSIESARAVRK